MIELLKDSIQIYNLPLTILLGMVVLYWLISALGVIDLDLEMDFDADLDLDLEIDADADAGATPSGSGNALGALGGLLKFINADKIPITIVISLMVLIMWTFGMSANLVFNKNGSSAFGLILLLPNFVASLVITKAITLPLRRVFDKLPMEVEKLPSVVGRSGIVKSASVDTKYGQVEISTESAPILINARTSSEDQPSIPKGTEVLVYEHDEDNNHYLVRTS